MYDDYSTIYATEFVDHKGRKGKGHIHFGGTANGVTPERAAEIIEQLNMFPGYKQVTIHPSRAQTPGDLATMVKMVPKEPRSSQILIPAFAKTPKPTVGSRFETLIGLEKEEKEEGGEDAGSSRFEAAEEGGGAGAPPAPQKLVNEAANAATGGVSSGPEGSAGESVESAKARVEQGVKKASEQVRE